VIPLKMIAKTETRDFKNGIGKRVGNEFFIRLNRLDYAFSNAFSNAFPNAFPNAFDHGFSAVLNGAVFDIVFFTAFKRFKN
jgi:hypothetical protein